MSQVQSWEQDPKLDKISKLLWDERRLEAPTVEDHRKFRRQAEEILGPEENLFRIDWVSSPPLPPLVSRLSSWRVARQLPESKTITFQLLSKDGSSLDDAEVFSGRWKAYVEGFVSETETPGVPSSRVRRPYLRRSAPPFPHPTLVSPKSVFGRSLPGGTNKAPPGADNQDFYARGGLEIKVCVRTYRLFYVSRTEDVLWRVRPAAERERAAARLAARDTGRTRWLENFTSPRGGSTSETAVIE